jgi:alpha-L-fucosidase 2
MNHRLTLQTPASFWGAQWRDALPAGNGMIGISVYGGVHRERILLNHGNLW